MDNILVKYSDYFQDDGGFDKMRSDFKNLGDDLIKEAKRIRDSVNIFDLNNAEGLSEYEQQAEQLSQAWQDLEKSKSNMAKVEKQFIKEQKKGVKITEQSLKRLDELNKILGTHKQSLKIVNSEEKKGNLTLDQASKKRGRLNLVIKETNKAINLEQKEITESNKLSRKEQKLLKAKITLQKKEVTTIEEIRERLSALRLVASQVNITTQEGRDTVAAYNAEIDDLTDTLSDNSDKFIQNKINVGNYEESIKNALESTGLFSTQIGVLDDTLNGVLKIMTLNKEELAKMEVALEGNAKGIKKFAIAFGKLNKVMKVSIIGIVILLIASIGAAFSQGRKGAIRMQKAMEGFATTMKVLKAALQEFGIGIGFLFKGVYGSFVKFGNSLKIWALKIKKFFISAFDKIPGVNNTKDIQAVQKQIKELKKELADTNAINNYSKAWESFGKAFSGKKFKAVSQNMKAINEQFKVADKIRNMRIELTKLNAELERLEFQGSNATLGLVEQIEFSNKALEKRKEILTKENLINKENLKLANLKLRTELTANGKGVAGSVNSEAFTKNVLSYVTKAGTQSIVSDDLLDAALDALATYKEGLEKVKLSTLEINKQIAEHELDLFERKLDFQIDFIDKEKDLSEQMVNDIRINYRDRLIEFNRFVKVFQNNAQSELQSINDVMKKLGKDAKLDVEYNPDGTFKLFLNDTEFAIENIEGIHKEMQRLNITDKVIGRFRGWVVETQNAVKDFRILNGELKKTGHLVNELSLNLGIDKKELSDLTELTEKIKVLNAINQNELNEKERNSILSQLEKLEKEKTKIIQDADIERKKNRLASIDDQLKQTKIKMIDGVAQEVQVIADGSDKQLQLLRERAAIEKDLLDSSTAQLIQSIKDKNKAAKEQWEKFRKELTEILNAVFDKLVEISNKEVTNQEKKVSKQEAIVESQRRRAENGLSNTLAFEQREMAKREAELIKRQKRQTQIEKLQSYWNTYNANLKSLKDNETSTHAILKTLKSIAVMESVTAGLSSFGDGGIIGIDGMKTNGRGITRGRSHNMNGGTLAFHENGEGFLSKNEMGNIGNDNFYKFKHMASLGALDKNFFSDQNRSFSTSISTVAMYDTRLVNAMNEVTTAIKTTPSQKLNVPEVVDGILKFTETLTTGNVTRRNHYKIRKPRL